MADHPLSNKDKVRAELKLEPGMQIQDIAKKLDVPRSSVSVALSSLAKSDDFEDKRLMAKREAYKNGGAQVVNLIKKQPGASYLILHTDLSMSKKRVQTKIGDLDTIFKKLVHYCKTYNDEALREILLKHKKADGYWPK